MFFVAQRHEHFDEKGEPDDFCWDLTEHHRESDAVTDFKNRVGMYGSGNVRLLGDLGYRVKEVLLEKYENGEYRNV
jgi:hypothetical protein